MDKSSQKYTREPDDIAIFDNTHEFFNNSCDPLSSTELTKKQARIARKIAWGVSLLTFLIYLTSLWNEFVFWDDDWYIFQNPHIRSIDPAFFKWAFLDYYAGNWHPLTWISHALDYAVWGANPVGHHLTNNILHAANTFLVVLLTISLIRIYRERAANRPSISEDDRKIFIAGGVTGLLFGLHPLHVESVAWASERKDLLCALFFLLSIKSYIKYAGLNGREAKQNSIRLPYFTKQYFISAGFFSLALLSKPMAITLPIVLFILDLYPLSRIHSFKSFRNVCIEKIPFIVLSLISSVLTVLAQKAGGALNTVVMALEPLSSRLALAAKTLISYLGMMILPLDLIPLYPYPKNIAPLSSTYLLPSALVIAITIICFIFVKKQGLWLAAWSYYVVTLIPVLGLVPVGIQSMADRYTYLPSLGPFIIAGLLVSWGGGKVMGKRGSAIKVASAAVALLVVVVMAYLTFKQIRVWKNNITLWSHLIAVEPERVPTAYGNRGDSFADRGELNKAIEDYNKAIALAPFYPDIYFERGLVFAKMHQFDKAISDYNQAIILDQNGLKSDVGRKLYFLNRGLAYLETARFELAVSDLKLACDMGSGRGCRILESYIIKGAKPGT